MISSCNSTDKWKEVMDYAMANHVIDTVQFIEKSGIDPVDVAKLFAERIPQNPLCHLKFYEMFQHVYATKDFIRLSFSMRSMVFEFIPYGFEECCCQGFHRLKSPRRNALEKGIVDRLKTFGNTKPIELLSMGSGGLMGDFILLEKLILAGFKIITLDCVEPRGINEDQLKKLRGFFSNIPEISISVEVYKDISDVPKKEYTCVTAIDYDQLAKETKAKTLKTTADLMKAYSVLNKSGFVALGYGKKEDIFFGPAMEPTPLNSSSAICKTTVGVQQLLSKKKELMIGIPTLTSDNLTHQAMMCVFLASKNASFEKIFVHINSTKIEEDKALLPDFKKMMEVMFPSSIEISIEEGPSNKEVDINFVS